MPYVDNDIPLATKRKREHAPNDEPYLNKPSSQRSPHEASTESFHASISPPTTRKTLHPTKRLRATTTTIHQDSDTDVHSSSHHRPSSREPPITCPSAADNAGKVNSTALLPCHVCHRRPTKKSDLDSFARCQACREQTCFICMRECQGRSAYARPAIMREDGKGDDEEVVSRSFRMDDADTIPSRPHTDNVVDEDDDVDVDIGEDDAPERKRERYTHHSMICSRCCVEKGAQGEVICLGCLSDPYTNIP
ncbi:hypothetical protein TgHK011_000589 [Trichoderma gracile]|nr:hypothetical protein TgHK011_000589 [Trichoderma gracile]